MVVLVTDTVYRWLGLWQFTDGCACNRYSLQMVVLGADTVYRGLCWLWQTQFTDGCACNRHSLQMVVLVTDTVYRWLCLLWQFICGWACCDSLQMVVLVVSDAETADHSALRGGGSVDHYLRSLWSHLATAASWPVEHLYTATAAFLVLLRYLHQYTRTLCIVSSI